MLITLRLNAVFISFSQQELVDLGLGLADGSIDYENALVWIHSHIKGEKHK